MRAARRGRDGKGWRTVGKGGEGAVVVTASKWRRGEADRIALLHLAASLDLAAGCGMVILSCLDLCLCAGTARLWNMRSLRSDHAPCGVVRGPREA